MNSCLNLPRRSLSASALFWVFLLVSLLIVSIFSLNISASSEVVDDISPRINSNGSFVLRGQNYLEGLDYWYFSDYSVYLSRNGNTFSVVLSGSVPAADFTPNYTLLPGDQIYVVYSALDVSIQSLTVTFERSLGSISGTTDDDGIVTIKYIPTSWQQSHNYLPQSWQVTLNGDSVASGRFGTSLQFTFEAPEGGIYYVYVYFADNNRQQFGYSVSDFSVPDLWPDYDPPSVNDTQSFFGWFYSFFNWNSGFGAHIVAMISLVAAGIAMKFLLFGVR